MAFEGKKMDELKWVIASPFNQNYQINKAIKIQGGLGIVLSLLSIAYAVLLLLISPLSLLSGQSLDFYIICVTGGALHVVLGVTFLIFNILLLTRADHEDSVTKIIRAGCYILSIFGFPMSLLAICGIVQSKKDLIKAYVIFLFVMMIITVFSLIGWVVSISSDSESFAWLLSGNVISSLFWYRYSMNMFVIQVNIM